MRMLFHRVRDLGRVFALAPQDQQGRSLGLGEPHVELGPKVLPEEK